MGTRFSTAKVAALKQTRTIKQMWFITIASLLAVVVLASPFAAAADYSAQINDLQQKVNGAMNERSRLGREAQTLESQVATLQAEISGIEAQIHESEAKKAAAEAAIAKAEAELDEQRVVLSANIKQKYINNELSTLEMLATSKSLADYMDREQSLSVVQNKIESIMSRINELKAKLEAEHAKIQQLLADQTAMRDSAAAKKAEVDKLLAYNQQQRDSFNAQIAANSGKISALLRQQAIENNRYNIGSPTYGGTGGYPWANVAYPSYSADPWGMYKRECVSYTAWRVAVSGRHMPYWGGRGNANEWDDNARAAGIPVDGNPRVGDIAVSNAGRYGHVMYVEAVHGSTITVSQYNAALDGRYSIATRSVSGLVFIHF